MAGALMHPEAYAYVRRALKPLPKPTKVIEFGGANVNGTVRDLLCGAVYYSIDLRDADGVDEVADAATWTPVGDAPDLVICTEVLEHSDQGEAICANAHRILAPGGALIITAATTGRLPHSGNDGGPLWRGEYYRNVSFDDLYEWLRPFAVASYETNTAAHDIYATAVKG